jgi:hypothetical protein
MAEGASPRYLEKVFMDATDPIVIEDLEGQVIDGNAAAAQGDVGIEIAEAR